MSDAEDDPPPPADAPAVAPTIKRRTRWLRSRSGLPRAVTVSTKRARPDVFETRRDTEFVDQFDRPKVRSDCLGGGINAARPCPWAGCKYHLYIDVNPETGSLKFNFPSLEPDQIESSCALDLAEKGGITLEEAGKALALTRERARQIEVRALIKLKLLDPEATTAHDYVPPRRETVKHAVARKGRPRRRLRDDDGDA